eukprot:GHVU01207882.1.p2 GENE.GHVU01207882.1~~GHVU01207882.1.p2  ORF type:complete len:106 (+),score=10.24 GHVU01207882.1:938-1255(+)
MCRGTVRLTDGNATYMKNNTPVTDEDLDKPLEPDATYLVAYTQRKPPVSSSVRRPSVFSLSSLCPSLVADGGDGDALVCGDLCCTCKLPGGLRMTRNIVLNILRD